MCGIPDYVPEAAQQQDPSPCMLLLQVHTLMQQSQAMTAQQLQAFAAQTQAVQVQGQLPGAAASQQAAAGGVQQPGAALMPQLPQMSGATANPRRPMSGQLPGAAALQQAAAGGAQQPGAALMPQPPQMSGVTANPRSPSPTQLPAAQPAVLPAFQGMLRGPGDQPAAPAVQVGKASRMHWSMCRWPPDCTTHRSHLCGQVTAAYVSWSANVLLVWSSAPASPPTDRTALLAAPTSIPPACALLHYIHCGRQ